MGSNGRYLQPLCASAASCTVHHLIAQLHLRCASRCGRSTRPAHCVSFGADKTMNCQHKTPRPFLCDICFSHGKSNFALSGSRRISVSVGNCSTASARPFRDSFNLISWADWLQFHHSLCRLLVTQIHFVDSPLQRMQFQLYHG